MNIRSVYVGGWFQRTRLHLAEIYDFLRDAESPLDLDKEKLLSLHKDLSVSRLEMTVNRLEFVLLECGAVESRIYEDGLIILRTNHTGNLESDITLLTEFYEAKLSPAFSYLFSLGAPVPKELANIKTVYPYFVTAYDVNESEAATLFENFSQKQYFAITHDKYHIYRADKLYLIHQHGATDEETERFIEEQIFLREFRGQLHSYLNLHRSIWEKIAEVHEKGSMVGYEVPVFKNKIDEYKKTIDFIDTRMHQMDTYLVTRGKIASDDARLSIFKEVLAYKHETLKDSLEYVFDIWDLTKRYVNSASEVFTSLAAKSTSNDVKNLTVVTSMGVGATLIGLFTTKSMPEFTLFGLLYFITLVLVGYSVNRMLKWWSLWKVPQIWHTFSKVF